MDAQQAAVSGSSSAASSAPVASAIVPEEPATASPASTATAVLPSIVEAAQLQQSPGKAPPQAEVVNVESVHCSFCYKIQHSNNKIHILVLRLKILYQFHNLNTE